MFKKQSLNSSKIFKGSAAALATVFTLSFLPVQVIGSSADYVGGGVGSEAIYVQNIDQTAPTNGDYEIRAGYFGSEGKIPVGLESYGGAYLVSYDGKNEISAIQSSVKVTYANSGAELEITKNADVVAELGADPSSAVYGTVEFTEAGEYIVEYSIDATVNHEVKHFSTEYSVFSTISSAYFDFAENDKKIVPSYYDINLVKSKNNGNLVDMQLPLPSVLNETDEEQNVTFVSGNDTTAVSGAYVSISVTGGNNEVTIAVDKIADDNFVIPAKYFDSESSDFAGTGNFVIKYSYYNEARQFVSSITKTYTVAQEHYTNYDYELSVSTSQISAITGVAVSIPTVSAKTTDETSPAGESVAIAYNKVTAYKMGADGSYTETRDGSIVDGKFTPWADGSYQIVYETVDFYGVKKSYKDIYIDDVKDTRNPVAIVYDAGDKDNYNDDSSIKEYIDASTKLKSKTQVNNIIIYAIGATDNVSTAENMQLTRSVRSSSRTIEIENKYAKYNILFDYKFDTLFSNNITLYNQIKDEVNTANETEVLAWLKENNYLIATNDENATIEDGYAYINVTLSGELMLTGSASGTTYTVRYYAKDEAGNSASTLRYDISVTNDTSFADSEAPVVTFPTSLKNSYSVNSVISFEQPTASDDTDTRMNVAVEYQYKTADNYEYGWVALEDDYQIKLSEITGSEFDQGTPVSVTIRAKTVDDYGNQGDREKNIEIANIVDEKVPSLIFEKYQTPNTEKVEQNAEVILPILEYEDDYVSCMNTQVFVNRVTIVDDERIETPVTVNGVKELQKSNGIYRVDTGKFIAAYEGTYEVKVVVTDAGGNQITTFYNYEANGTTYISNPKIQAPSTIGDSGEVELGEEIEFETPTIAYSLKDNQGIIGVSADKSNSATNYFIQIVNDAPSGYEFRGDTFVSFVEGNFEFQYVAKVTVYDKDIFTAENDQLYYTNENITKGLVQQDLKGNLIITSDTDLIYGLLNEDNQSITLYDIAGAESSPIEFADGRATAVVSGKTYTARFREKEGLIFVAPNGDELTFTISDEGQVNIGGVGFSASAVGDNINAEAIKTYTLTSDTIIKAKVSDTTAPEIGEYDYPTSANVGTHITIKKITATDLSVSGIDKEKSYVLISYKGGNTTSSRQIFMNEWEQATGYTASTGDIDYTLSSNGNYTISYYVYDHQGNLNDDRTYSIAVGDCDSPKIELPKDLIQEKYELGKPLILDFAKIKGAISDNVTDLDTLLETLEIKVINTATSEELENTANADEFKFSYKLDTAGTYKIEISVRDEAGWTTKDDSLEFEVSTDQNEGMSVYEIVGIVLIVVACLVLAGVILYFVINKVKKSKKRQVKNSDTKKNDVKKSDKK